MSCNSATAPVDINKGSTEGPCSLKCRYQFNYSPSSCNVKNEGSYISINYDKQSGMPPVKYNNVFFNVQEVRLFRPSLHTYNGSKAAAEMIIVHSGDSNNLLVCIPIKSIRSTF